MGPEDNGDLEALLEQNSELQRDLASTAAIVQRVREENEAYRGNFEGLKMAHVRLTEAHVALQARLQDAENEKERLEGEHEDLVRVWKSELEEKTREFETLRSKLVPPREAELLRIKLLGEVEAPFQARIAEMESESGRVREAYHSLRREHELLRTRAANAERDAMRRAAEAAAERDATVADLRAKLDRLAAEMEEDTSRDQVQELEKRNAALELKNKKMVEELGEVRKHTERARAEADQIGHEHARELQTQQTAYRRLESEKETLAMKLAHRERELQEETAAVEDLRLRLAQQEKALANAKSEAGEMRDNAKQDRAAAQELERELERQRAEAQRNAGTLTRQMNEVQERVRELEAARQDAEREHGRELARVRAEAEDQLRRMRFDLGKASDELELAQRAKDEALAQAKSDAQQLRKEIDAARSERDVVRVQEDAYQEQLRTLQGRLSAQQAETEAVQVQLREVRNEAERLREDNASLQTSEAAMAAGRDQLSTQVDFLKRDASQHVEALAQARDEATRDIAKNKNALLEGKRRFVELNRRWTAKVAASEKRTRKVVRLLKASRAKWNKVARQLKHDRSELKAALAKERARHDGIVEDMKNEHREVVSRMRAAERSRDELRLLGGGGGFSHAAENEEAANSSVMAEVQQMKADLDGFATEARAL